MHFKHLQWSVKRIHDSRSEIDPKPQYQRGPVWGDPKRQLLIDSIINHFDIPKIYLRHVKGIGAFDYEVADGQQRLTAIWDFLDDVFPLGEIDGAKSSLSGLHFSELPAKDQQAIHDYEFVIAAVYQASNDEIRELFARLQKGEKLNPAELRNSMASALGDVIRAMAATHKFFTNSPFSKSRFKPDDLLAHAFGIRLFNFQRDIKAADLAAMYKEYKQGIEQGHISVVNNALEYLTKIQSAEPNCIRTKWGFVDLFGVFSNNNGVHPDPKIVATKYREFEKKRLQHTKNPGNLLGAGSSGADKRLYDYIVAFQAGGGTKENLKARHDVLTKVLC